MRMRTPIFMIAAALALGACGEDPPAKDPSSAKDAGEKSSSGGGDHGGGGGGGGAFTCKGKADVGKTASPFTMESMTGGKVGVEPGKVTLVDFWATWCGPCEKSFPKYQELYVKYKASGLEIAAVSVDDEKKDIPAFVKKTSVKFPVGWSADSKKIADCYTVPNMPSAYLVDKKGVVRFVHHGFKDDESKKIEEEIKSLL
jgi:cytochrome c biogenesis protein CcmG, thiol:disulfide interchange protein DsbE